MSSKALFVKANIYTSIDCMGKERQFFIDVDYEDTDKAQVIHQKIKDALAKYIGGYPTDIEEITYISVL